MKLRYAARSAMILYRNQTLKFNPPRRSPTYELSLFSNENTIPTFVRYTLLNISRREQMSALWFGQFFL
jgi:hypothetical protein